MGDKLPGYSQATPTTQPAYPQEYAAYAQQQQQNYQLQLQQYYAAYGYSYYPTTAAQQQQQQYAQPMVSPSMTSMYAARQPPRVSSTSSTYSSQPVFYSAQYMQQQQQLHHQQQQQQPITAATPAQQQQKKRNATPQVETPCEPCQKTFANYKMYEAHCLQHVTCEQCGFRASKRVIKDHQRKMHPIIQTAVPASQTAQKESNVSFGDSGARPSPSTGAAKRKAKDPERKEAQQAARELQSMLKAQPVVKTMDSPEEIERWIAERKKRYPTADNIAKKREEERERLERASKTERLQYEREQKQRQVQLMATFRQDLPEKILGKGFERKLNLNAVGDGKNKRRRLEEPPSTTDVNERLEGPSLNGDPGSNADSGSDGDGPPEEQGTSRQDHDTRKTRRCKYYLKGRCIHGVKCAYLHERPPKNATVSTSSSAAPAQPSRKRRNLFESLLAVEKQKERELVFQAVDYIVESDFFQLPDVEMADAGDDIDERREDHGESSCSEEEDGEVQEEEDEESEEEDEDDVDSSEESDASSVASSNDAQETEVIVEEDAPLVSTEALPTTSTSTNTSSM